MSEYLQRAFWGVVLLFAVSLLTAMSIILWKVALS